MLKAENLILHVEDNGAKKCLLDHISFQVDDGEMLVITGPNGGGKSTLAKLIAGIEKPVSGRILFDQEDITEKSITDRANMGISYAFQQPVRFKGIQVLDLIRLAAKRKMSAADACEYLSEVGLCAKDYINREVNASLSGGELKRIEIATVLARGTKLSVFDEPEAGIDLWSFSMLIEQFEKMHKEKKQSLILISHQERIIQMADRIMVIEGGKIASIGQTADILPQLLGKTADSYSCLKCR